MYLKMLNSKPNNKNYHQGNYIPKYRDKVIKLNNEGGVYYRSSWEKKVMVWLDNSEKVCKWGAECITIPYRLTHFDKGDISVKNHNYYPDFYYEIKIDEFTTKKVVAELKPMKEYNMVISLQEKDMKVPISSSTLKSLKSFEYDLKMAQKNTEKWRKMIDFCDKKGWSFIIITEEHLKKFNL
jgi:hypothetical protein